MIKGVWEIQFVMKGYLKKKIKSKKKTKINKNLRNGRIGR